MPRPGEAQVILVTTANDAGPGSLRQAILDANGTAGFQSIHFAIGGGGSVATLQPLTDLPTLTETATLDGTTQGCGTGPCIEIDGSLGANTGLRLGGRTITIEGFIINRCATAGLLLTGINTADNQILNSYIGTNAAGDAARPNGEGIRVEGGANDNLIQGNLISGNTGAGIHLRGPGTAANRIENNTIGADLAGLSSLGNGAEGIVIAALAAGNIVRDNGLVGNAGGVRMEGLGTAGNRIENNRIGGVLGNGGYGVVVDGANGNAITGNRISGNTLAGIRLEKSSAAGNQIDFNQVGTDAAGTGPVPNGGAGMMLVDGATSNGLVSNTVAFNTGGGVVLHLDAGTGNRISQNSTFSNQGLGIDLGNDGPTANDPDDPDAGPNRTQNFPEIGSVAIDDTSPLTQAVTLNAIYRVPTAPAHAAYPLTVEFFRAGPGGEGLAYLGADTYPAAEAGAFKTATLTATVPAEGLEDIVATATDADGNTSEFSAVYNLGVQVSLTVFLPGPLDCASGMMQTDLLTGGLLPAAQPYADDRFLGTPLFHTGPETSTFPTGQTVDWVLVDLRSAETPDTRVSRQAALLEADGQIRSALGGVLVFPGVPAGEYYVVVRHRNHLPLMTAAPVTLSALSLAYEFPTQGAFGLNAQVLPFNCAGPWAMRGGDGNHTQGVTAFDFLHTWLPINGGPPAYADGDFNLDGSGTAFDFLTVWLPSHGHESQVPD